MGGEALEVERRLRQDDVHALALDDLEHRVREAGVRSGRDEVERVAEVTADGALGHVRADEAHVALAVLAERPEQRGGSRRAGGRDEDGDGTEAHARSILSSASWVRRRSRSASSIARMVCPIVSPG